MAKPNQIDLVPGVSVSILYEDRAVMAIDKPAGWLLAPDSWDKTSRNLHAALCASLAAGDYWARSRHLKFLRFVHRLDADATGVLLCAKHPGVIRAYSQLFASRRVDKTYLAVVEGVPAASQWQCALRLAPDAREIGRMRVDHRRGKEAATSFRVLQAQATRALIEAHPLTGRSHQIRVHLAASGHPIVNDPLYGKTSAAVPRGEYGLALRAIALAYLDPFQKRRVHITASFLEFTRQFGFDLAVSYPE